MNPQSPLPPEFLALPETLRERILQDGDALGQRVVGHAAQILIGPPASLHSDAKVDHASSVQVRHGSYAYLATAAHVIRKFAERTRNSEPLVFQVSNTLLPALERVVWIDDKQDLAILELQSRETDLIFSTPWFFPYWPPRRPRDGDFVAFAGYPREYRVDEGPAAITLNAIGGLLQVESASERRLITVMTRERLIVTRGPAVPPQHAEMGGMSGGPVFYVSGDALELVGVITDYGNHLDTWFFATFADVDLTPSMRVVV